MTNTLRMDAEASWFFIYYKKDLDGKNAEAAVDPFEVLTKRFPAAERRLLRELCEELRSTGPWVPRTIDASDWHGAYS
jgi:hypothetical protein